MRVHLKKRSTDIGIDTESLEDYAIYVTGFPKTTKLKELKDHFSRWGDVHEIVFSYRFGKILKRYMAQDKINKKIRH